ncbi:MAG: trypsin-like peptidase domain-containing protein [Anaerolineae bacterium]|nr:S1C family serine protease [Thermoflexales bacterium]MDW8394836.1 trypsin-like peptidase domain-containing protein [Anaerolineae bacterium]
MTSLTSTLRQQAAEIVRAARQSVVQVQLDQRGLGAGIIWHSGSQRSRVLTNAHVVAAAGRRPAIRVKLPDERSVPAEVVATQRELDLALLEVPLGGLKPARRRVSNLPRPGELVFAIGHPFGDPEVVTVGLISGIGYLVWPRQGQRTPYLFSDVRLAPGNSGGPLINADGEVVGIAAMIIGGDLSTAIPALVAQRWVEQGEAI